MDHLLDVTTQEGYDIAGALRGPDRPGVEDFKHLLTARLRKLAGMDVENHLCADVRTEPMSSHRAEQALKQANKWREEDPVGFHHYLHHIQYAARPLKDYNLEQLAVEFEADTKLSWDRIVRLGGGEEEKV